MGCIMNYDVKTERYELPNNIKCREDINHAKKHSLYYVPSNFLCIIIYIYIYIYEYLYRNIKH